MMRILKSILIYVRYRIISIVFYSVCFLRTPKLIRFAIPWVISNLKPCRSPLDDEKPWITFEAKEWLGDFLTQDLVVFEWGSGGSTIFISKRVKKLISVEHDRLWYQRVFDILKEKNISNCEYLLFEPQPAPDNQSDFTDPYGFASSSPEYAKMSFEAYVGALDKFPDKSFDLVFIDGRARPSCILHARDKICFGGFLLLDNSERDSYLLSKKLLADWKQVDFFGPGPYNIRFWQTSVWKKPFGSVE